jgi:hypothetical protein
MALTCLTSEQKHNTFGRIEYVPAPNGVVPEGIRITNGWNKQYLRKVTVPQLAILAKKYPNGCFPKDGVIFWNKLGEAALLQLFRTLEEKELLHNIISWGGAWAPRFIRGSSSVLSSHAWATAFDVNAAWNPLGRPPAQQGQKGCLLDVIPEAEKAGFYWGGNFPRKDGMHFELTASSY